MKTVILGIGNPLLGDDGAGWRVADQIRQLFTPNSELNIENCSLDGLSLMEKISGYDAAILIDTIYTGINKKRFGAYQQFIQCRKCVLDFGIFTTQYANQFRIETWKIFKYRPAGRFKCFYYCD